MAKHFCFYSALTVAILLVSFSSRADDTAGEQPAKIEPSATASAPAGQLYDLKYKFTSGETLRTEVVFLATVQTTMQGVSQTAETQSTSIKLWTINEAGDGKVGFVHSVESVDMREKTQGRPEVHYNSRTDDAPPPGHEEVAKAIGVPLTIALMDDRGIILKRIEKRPQPSSLSTQMTMPLPAEPVAVGQKWSTPMDIDVYLKDNTSKKIRTRQQFTLRKVSEDVATIDVDTQILSPVTDPAIEAQLIQRVSQGTVRFDISTGRVLSQQLDLDRHVIGFSGPASSMHYVTRFTEQLLPNQDKTARRPAPKAK